MTREVIETIKTFGDMQVGDCLRRKYGTEDDDLVKTAVKNGKIHVDSDGYLYLPVLASESLGNGRIFIRWGNWITDGGSEYDPDGTISSPWIAVRVRYIIHEPEELPI